MYRGLRIIQELPGYISLNRNAMNTYVRITDLKSLKNPLDQIGGIACMRLRYK